MDLRKLLFVCLSCLSLAWAAGQKPSGDGQQIVSFLNQTVEWHRQIITAASATDVPGELIFTANQQQNADQIALLAFQFARAEASLGIANGQIATSADNPNTDIIKLQIEAQAKIASIQQEIDQVQNSRVRTKADRDARDTKLQELQSELALAQARLDTLKSFSGFVRQTITNNSGTKTFSEQVDQLARSAGLPVPTTTKTRNTASSDADGTDSKPTATQQTQQQQAQVATASAQAEKQQPSGIVGMIEQSVALGRKSHDLERLINTTESLQATMRRLRDPLVTELQETVKQGTAVEQAADSADISTLGQQAKQLDQYTARFKQLSAAVLPLGEQSVLLDAELRQLQQWQAFVRASNVQVLRRIGVQALVVLMAIAVLLGFAELWKRATFRYIHDIRRRAQFLLLRRIVLGLVITFIVAFALVTQAGSLATYAGFLTAGLAVALQNVILSVVAYFFLIGRYGIHVGDRVTINGVTGDVFDIGLVRLHVVEVSGEHGDQHATGRSVVFSNAVILQPATNLFKQLPGSDFAWHDVRFTLAPDSDVTRIEKQLLAAVQRIFDTYGSRLRLDTYSFGGHVRFEETKPTSRLRLADTGLELVIRYPVLLDNAAEIDDRIARTMLEAIAREPEVRLVPTTAPSLQWQQPEPPSAAA